LHAERQEEDGCFPCAWTRASSATTSRVLFSHVVIIPFAVAMNFQRKERRRERDHRLFLVRSLDALLLHSNGKGSSRKRETNWELENQIRIDNK
jgi:hypothetical protein